MSILKDGMKVFVSKDVVIAGGEVFRVEIERNEYRTAKTYR